MVAIVTANRRAGLAPRSHDTASAASGIPCTLPNPELRSVHETDSWSGAVGDDVDDAGRQLVPRTHSLLFLNPLVRHVDEFDRGVRARVVLPLTSRPAACAMEALRAWVINAEVARDVAQ